MKPITLFLLFICIAIQSFPADVPLFRELSPDALEKMGINRESKVSLCVESQGSPHVSYAFKLYKATHGDDTYYIFWSKGIKSFLNFDCRSEQEALEFFENHFRGIGADSVAGKERLGLLSSVSLIPATWDTTLDWSFGYPYKEQAEAIRNLLEDKYGIPSCSIARYIDPRKPRVLEADDERLGLVTPISEPDDRPSIEVLFNKPFGKNSIFFSTKFSGLPLKTGLNTYKIIKIKDENVDQEAHCAFHYAFLSPLIKSTDSYLWLRGNNGTPSVLEVAEYFMDSFRGIGYDLIYGKLRPDLPEVNKLINGNKVNAKILGLVYLAYANILENRLAEIQKQLFADREQTDDQKKRMTKDPRP